MVPLSLVFLGLVQLASSVSFASSSSVRFFDPSHSAPSSSILDLEEVDASSGTWVLSTEQEGSLLLANMRHMDQLLEEQQRRREQRARSSRRVQRRHFAVERQDRGEAGEGRPSWTSRICTLIGRSTPEPCRAAPAQRTQTFQEGPLAFCPMLSILFASSALMCTSAGPDKKGEALSAVKPPRKVGFARTQEALFFDDAAPWPYGNIALLKHVDTSDLGGGLELSPFQEQQLKAMHAWYRLRSHEKWAKGQPWMRMGEFVRAEGDIEEEDEDEETEADALGPFEEASESSVDGKPACSSEGLHKSQSASSTCVPSGSSVSPISSGSPEKGREEVGEDPVGRMVVSKIEDEEATPISSLGDIYRSLPLWQRNDSNEDERENLLRFMMDPRKGRGHLRHQALREGEEGGRLKRWGRKIYSVVELLWDAVRNDNEGDNEESEFSTLVHPSLV